MTQYASLAVLMALSAVVIAVAVGWVLAAVAASAMTRVAIQSPAIKANILAQIRLLPLVLPATVVPMQIAAFARFEAGGREFAGPLLISTAIVGAVLVIDALISAARVWRRTHGVVTTWRAAATPLSVPIWSRPAWRIHRRFPIVAVVGVIRPQLFIANRVEQSCTPRELAAIAAHEAAHVAARDNLLRCLFCLTPGARWCRAIAEPLEAQWNAAAEEAADVRARNATSAIDLASALTKVARLAADCAPDMLPVSTLIGGDQLHRRVRRLLDEPPSEHRAQWLWLPGAFLVAATIAVLSTSTLGQVHELFELLVRR